jgi:predicted membrane channel-forming protein YqfA (hemolysin III family)
MERQWLRTVLYVVLGFSAVMWFITLAASGSSHDLVNVARIDAAKTRYLIVFVLSLAGLTASSGR